MGLILVNNDERKATFYTCMSDVAEVLGVNKVTVYRWARSGIKLKILEYHDLYFNCDIMKAANKKGSKCNLR